MALYTQGQKIEVIVRKEDTTAATAGANDEAPEEAGAVADKEQDSAGVDTKTTKSKVSMRIMATKSLAASIAIGRLWLNYYVSGKAYRTGDEAQQDAAQRNLEMIEEGGGILASIGIGATYGARGGPLGIVLGASLAALTTASSIGVKYAGKVREYNMKLFKEENGIEYKRARANLSLTTGRLR